mmetsp:Transcript_102573/g.289772  ORF Transcript_102573/g.289772 Transcript_102573/m.289772 type:complete len:224 (-) Transcript_102573:695-1366(-)
MLLPIDVTLGENDGMVIVLAGHLHRLRKAVHLHREPQFASVLHETLRPEEKAEKNARIHLSNLLVDGLLALAVVLPPQIWIGQDLVGLGQLLEPRRRIGVFLVLVGVALPRLLVIRLLDLGRRSAWANLQQVVILRVRDVRRNCVLPLCLRGLLLCHLAFEGAEVCVNPTTVLLVPNPLLLPASVCLGALCHPSAYLQEARCCAAQDDGSTAQHSQAKALGDA